MKKSITSAIVLILLITILGFYINDAKVQRTNLYSVDESIEKIILLNKDFDLYLKNSFSYDNFDLIQFKIESFKNELNTIQKNKIIYNIKDNKILVALEELTQSMQIKFETIERVKSYRAILNNSFRIIQRIRTKDISNDFNSIYTLIMTVDKNPELNIEEELLKINKLIPLYTNKYEKYFLKHSQKILEYQNKFSNIAILLQKLSINNKLQNLSDHYNQYSQSSIQKAQLSIKILFILLVISIILYLVYEYKLKLSNKELSKFRKTVENSDNIVVITDKNEVIKYVNEAFTKTTGYTAQEVIGQKPSILKSGKQSIEFYKELHDTIHSGKKWSGNFINIDKYGALSYEKASITPVIDDGKIKEFISIKLDITKETKFGQQLKQKEELLVQQSKMAAMGEMLENIAHQWRQPLSVISTISTGVLARKEIDLEVSSDEIDDIMNKINDTAQHLSGTIDNFRDFFNPKKKRILFNLKDIYIKTLNFVNSKFKVLNIEIIENLDDVNLINLDGEVIQVIMNLLNNARDVLEDKKDKRKLIFVDIYKNDDNAIVTIKDNGGGIPKNIINRIFEPYFTTKHKSQGTGIGLYMSREMVIKHIKGTLEVNNVTYKYENEKYTGAEFKIQIPLK